jgi:hypothetical protein
MPRSKRKTVVVSKTGVSVDLIYCRKCMLPKKPIDFLEAVDTWIDSNGYMSICRQCLNELFDKLYASEGSYEKATLRLCRMINLKFSESAIQATLKQIETYKERGTESKGFFTLYKGKLYTTSKTSNRIDSTIDLTYDEVTHINVNKNELNDAAFDGAGKDLKDFWGNNFEEADYIWLEKELAEWEGKHDIRTKSEESLLQLIILKRFDIRKAREEGRDTTALEKSYQGLLDTSALSPKLSTAANSGENFDTFGLWIADIEKNEPAQWLETDGKPFYKDVDDVEGYFQRFFVRPLKNFILQSKDFNVDDESLTLDDDDGFDESDEVTGNADSTIISE